jgi:CHASE2 domain-containing sensor protein
MEDLIRMIDKNAATDIARKYLAAKKASPNAVPSLQEALTIEKAFGWVFFYNSAKYLETGDDRYALIGNSPLIVDRRDGSLHVTGSAQPIDFYITEYERMHPA